MITFITVIGLSACTPGGIVKANEPELAAQSAKIKTSLDDYKPLQGTGWVGTLNYLNYGSVERSTIPVELAFDVTEEKGVEYSIKYPGEEQYNDTAKLKVSKDGSKLDGQPVVKREVLDNGGVILTTAYRDKDDNRAADIRMTYLISTNEFKMIKDVKFDNQAEFFNRNEYAFTR